MLRTGAEGRQRNRNSTKKQFRSDIHFYLTLEGLRSQLLRDFLFFLSLQSTLELKRSDEPY